MSVKADGPASLSAKMGRLRAENHQLYELVHRVGQLLTQKRELIARLRENPSLYERTEIECVVTQIDTALDLLVPADYQTSQNARTEALSRNELPASKLEGR